MDKHTIPNIPTPQYVLEDISNPEIVNVNNYPSTMYNEDELLPSGYLCFKNMKQLEDDLNKQSGLTFKLDELNKKLVENIANMKKQV